MSNDQAVRLTQEKLNSPAVTLEGFDKRLLAYAAVAGAGLMAAAPCAEAGVIYNPTTFTNNYPGSSSFNIDLNGDTQNDFWFGTWSQTASYRSFYGGEMNGGQLLMRQQQVETDAQFIRGSNFIGPDNEQWVSTDRLARASGWQGSSSSYGSGSTWWVPLGVSGQFANTGEGYLGVRIPSSEPGSYNYGWIRFNITASDQTSDMPIGVTVRGWAFEQTPDSPIHAGDEGGVPEPGSLGLLAGGILGLAAWRRRKAAKG
jgi:hypothetical protein